MTLDAEELPRTPGVTWAASTRIRGLADASKDVVILNGGDPGVSFRPVHVPASGMTHPVLSNTTVGALADRGPPR